MFLGMKKKTLTRKTERAPMPEDLKSFFDKVTFQVVEQKKHNKLAQEQRILDYKAALTAERTNLEKTNRELEKYLGREEEMKEKSKESAEKMHERFSKNIWFDSFEIGDHFVIKTKLIFTDIRKSAGLRLKKRSCLGSFRIHLPTQFTGLDSNYTYVENQTFINGRANWAVSSGRVCWGEWRTDFDDVMRKKDYYQMFEMVVHLLRASDDDGAAYLRSHEWRDRREIYNIVKMVQEPIKPGDYVIFTGLEQDNLNILGYVSQLDSASGTLGRFSIKEIGGNKNHFWNVRMDKAQKIPKEMYDAQARYKIKTTESNPVESILKAIDELPDGSTHEDAVELAKSMSTRKEIQLDITQLMK